MWIKKYFRQLRLSLIIVPAVAVTLISLFALASAATDAAASSQPGDLLYPLQQPALNLKETLTQNPEAPARIELTPESFGLPTKEAVVVDPGVIQGSQEDANIGDDDLNSNVADNSNNSPEGGLEREASDEIKGDVLTEIGDNMSQEENAEFKDAMNNYVESDHNQNSSDDSAEGSHNGNSGHYNEGNDNNMGDDDDNSSNSNGNDDDTGDNDDNSGHGNGDDDGDDDEDNSGHGNGDDDGNSGRSGGDDDDDNGGSGGGDDDDEDKD